MKKPTLATLKSFVAKNRGALLIKCESSFDAMTDSTVYNHGAAFNPAQTTDRFLNNTLGVNGIWLVGRSRDYIQPISRDGFVGYAVSNCCGSFEVAVKAKE